MGREGIPSLDKEAGQSIHKAAAPAGPEQRERDSAPPRAPQGPRMGKGQIPVLTHAGVTLTTNFTPLGLRLTCP